MSPVEVHARRYLERWFTSRAHLRRLLLKRGEPDVVDRVLDRLVADGHLDDAKYARAKADALARRGASRLAIRAKLFGKGVRHVPEVDELAACCAYVRKRRLGPFRTGDAGGAGDTTRDLARVCRAGFPPRLARKVLAMDVDEIRTRAAG
jgi:regulatory protein